MTETPETPYILIVGDPVTGFDFSGPYPSESAALEVAETFEHTDWWVAPLEPPVTL